MDGLNPVEWFGWLYGKVFQRNAFWGGVIVVILSGLVGLFLWMRGVDKWKEEHRISSVAVEWHKGIAPPTYPPPDGRIFMLQAWPLPTESGGGGLPELSGTPGQKTGWPVGLSALECQITNYSSVPVFNITAQLHLTFTRAVRDPSQPGTLRGGEVFLSREWPINVAKINAGADHAFVFYVANFKDDQWVDIAFPQTITGQLEGETTPITIGVIQPPQSSVTILSPFVEIAARTGGA